jgi:hypothetical protein
MRAQREDRTPQEVILDGFSANIAWASEHVVTADPVTQSWVFDELAETAKLPRDRVLDLRHAFMNPEALVSLYFLWATIERPMPTQGVVCEKVTTFSLMCWSDGTVTPVMSDTVPADPQRGYSPGELATEIGLGAMNFWANQLKDNWLGLKNDLGTRFNTGMHYDVLERILMNSHLIVQFPPESRQAYGTLLSMLLQVARCVIREPQVSAPAAESGASPPAKPESVKPSAPPNISPTGPIIIQEGGWTQG